MSLVELLLQGKTTTPADLVKDLPGDNEAKAETIDNNLQHEIVKKMSSNSVYYGKLSEMLKKIIMQRKIEAMSYEEYLRQVVELAEAILHPETSGSYPDEIKDSAARRALYDYFEQNVELTIDVDGAIRISIQPEWKRNFQKQQRIRLAIYKKLLLHSYSCLLYTSQMGVARRYIISIGTISAAMIFMLQRKYLSCVSIR